jgi:hypothetical protein
MFRCFVISNKDTSNIFHIWNTITHSLNMFYTQYKTRIEMDHSKILRLFYSMSLKVTWIAGNNAISSCSGIRKKKLIPLQHPGDRNRPFDIVYDLPGATRRTTHLLGQSIVEANKTYVLYVVPWYTTYVQRVSYLYVTFILILVIIFTFTVFMSLFRTLIIMQCSNTHMMRNNSAHKVLRTVWSLQILTLRLPN